MQATPTNPAFSDPFHAPVPSHSHNPGVMHWPAFRDMYVESVKLRSAADSGHPVHVAAVLDRFTRYVNAWQKRLDEISQMDLLTYLTKRKADKYRGQPVGVVTLNNEIRIINAAFGKAGPRGRGRAAENWSLIPSPPYACEFQEPRRNAVVAEQEQLRRFLEAAADATSPAPEVCRPALFWRAVILLELTTRLRRRALLNLPRPSDRNLLELRLVILPAEFNKTGEELAFPLGGEQHGQEVARIMSELPTKPGEPLLPWRSKTGQRMTLAHFTYTLKKIQRAAGIPEAERFRLKDLRSTAGTLIADEFGDAVAKKALGHGPNTNTLATNYKSYRPREKDRQASDFMAAMAMDFVADDSPDAPPTIRFPGRSA